MSDSAPAELDLFQRRGTWVALAAPLAGQLVSLGVLAMLYRLVAPADFGLIGMLTPALMLPRMFVTLGLSTATVQADTLSPTARRQLFGLTMGLGLAAAVVTAAVAYVLSWAYTIPALANVGIALAGTTLFAAVANQHQALLERRMALGPLALARLVSQAGAGAMAVTIAWRGGGVLALIGQQYLELALLAAAVWLLEPWRPWQNLPFPWGECSGKVEPQQTLHSSELAPLLTFGTQVSLSNLLFYLAQNVHAWLTPLLLGNSEAAQAAIGMYTQAFNLMMRPVYLVTTPLTAVLLPALSRKVADRKQFAELAQRFFQVGALVLFPAAIGLVIVAPDAMTILGGERWTPAGWVLAALAPTILAQGLFNLCGPPLAAKGRGRFLVVAAGVSLVVLAQGLLAGFGVSRWLLNTEVQDFTRLVIGMALGYSLVSVLALFPPFLVFSLQTTDVPLAETIRPWFKPLRASVLMGLAVWLLRSLLAENTLALPPAMKVLVLITAGAALYAALMRKEIANVTRSRAISN